MIATLGSPGISGGSLPKLSFLGETPSFLILIDWLSAPVCADAAVKSAAAEVKDNSKTHAAANACVNDLKCFVNNQSPFRAYVITSDPNSAQVAQRDVAHARGRSRYAVKAGCRLRDRGCLPKLLNFESRSRGRP